MPFARWHHFTSKTRMLSVNFCCWLFILIEKRNLKKKAFWQNILVLVVKKRRYAKDLLVVVLLLIGWKTGARFFSLLWSVAIAVAIAMAIAITWLLATVIWKLLNVLYFFSMHACAGVRIMRGKAAFVRSVQNWSVNILPYTFLSWQMTRHLRRHKTLIRRRRGWLPFLSPPAIS